MHFTCMHWAYQQKKEECTTVGDFGHMYSVSTGKSMVLPLSASKTSFLSFLQIYSGNYLVPRLLTFREGRGTRLVLSLPENLLGPETLGARRRFFRSRKNSFVSFCANAAPMTEIQYDKSQFTKTLNLQAIRVPKAACSEVSRILNK